LKIPARNVACSPAPALKPQWARVTGCTRVRLPNAAAGATTTFVCFHFTGFPLQLPWVLASVFLTAS
jgi:hypothetical protein